MFRKRSLIVGLVGLNVALLAALLLSVTGLPVARAQVARPLPGDFIVVTSEVQGRDSDAVFLLDVPSHRLHVFFAEGPQTRKIQYIGSRDLEKDFPTQ